MADRFLFQKSGEIAANLLPPWGPPILNPNRGRVCPILGIVFQASAGGPQFRPKSEQSLAANSWRKWGHFGYPPAARDFLRIRGNRGHRIAGWMGPILRPNRGGGGPISGIASCPPPEAFGFTLNLSNP